MTHEHHHHERTVTSLNKAFILGIALNVAFVVVEFAVGLSYGSMGLLSDAGHNLSDVASLLLAMLAFRLAQAQATPRYTYGYKKSTVLISLLNSVILLIAVGVCRIFFLSDTPQAYDGMLPWLALLLVCSLFFPLLSVYRFKQGCQD